MDISLLIPLALGWLSGWLVNYLADVLPTTRKLYRPACPSCQKKYNWIDYLFFRDGPNCGNHRSPRVLIVQVVMTVAPLFIWLFPKNQLPFLLAWVVLVYLAIVFVIDFEHRVVLYPVSIAGAILGLGTGIFLRSHNSLMGGITSTLLGGLAGFGVMLLFYFTGVLFVRLMAKKRNMPPDEVALGFGDVTLAGILGLILGLNKILFSLFFAIVAGGLISLIIIFVMLISKKYKAFTAIPYAPFLILSAIYFIFF
jgi:prepilin signal peptidase PulO-like enzyme (type II secretory pathway)